MTGRPMTGRTTVRPMMTGPTTTGLTTTGRTTTVVTTTMTTEPIARADGSATVRFRSLPPDAPAGPPARDDATVTRRSKRGSRIPARVRIMAWLVLVMASGLSAVVILIAQLEYQAIDERVNRGLAQDAQEFQNFALAGLDPVTDRAIFDAQTLFDRYLTVQSTDRAEILVGVRVVGEELAVLPIVNESVQGFDLNDDLLRAILAAPDNSGQLLTSAGELRWIRTGVISAVAPSVAGEVESPGTTTTPDAASGPDPAATVDPDAWFVGGYLIDGARDEADSTVRTLIGVCAVALVLGAGISWLVAGQILAPVRTVRRAAAELTEDDLTQRIPVQGRDDISALAEQFNSMLDRLETAFRTRRQFLDDAGHELRTPITIVRGHLELMGDDPDERIETVRLCTDELDRMARIVDDMLLLAKAEQPDFVRPEWVSVPDLTSDIDAKVRALADRRWSMDGMGEGEAFLDPQRVTQAILQLAQNAVQHTVPGDGIAIGSTMRGGAVIFSVTDEGPGVPEQDVDRIFDRFTRGSGGALDRRGAGLGLAIVKAIAEAHHGRAWLASDPGNGASFGLELPAGPHLHVIAPGEVR
jgi:two-component system OmpR family sensor kinase